MLASSFGASALGAEDGPGTSDAIAARVPKQETGAESDHLTGNWGGLRDRLVDRGVHLYAGYTGEVLGNVSGGLRRGAVYEGLFELAVDLDTEKLGLWRNGLVHVSSIYPHGSSVSRYVGDILTVSNIDAFDSWRLYELWIEQRFADERFSVRFGQLLVDEEFTFSKAAENFINSAFGWPAFISGNVVNTGPAFYVAAPGVRLRYEPSERFFVQSGVYDGDTFDSPTGDPHVNASGTRIHLSGEQGIYWISEAGYHFKGASLEGEYKVGAWLHTGDFTSNFHDRNGDPYLLSGLEPKQHARNFGAYIAANQEIWRDEEANVAVFGRFGGSPPDRSLFTWVFDGGITATGVLPGRTDDKIGAGVAYASLSRDIRKAERLDARLNGNESSGFSDYEAVLELFYSVQITKWWTIQPDFQWIFNPGANTRASDAVVVGLRTSIAF
jgi:porin